MSGSAAPGRSLERFSVLEPDAIGSNRARKSVFPPEFERSISLPAPGAIEGQRFSHAISPALLGDVPLSAPDKFFYSFDRIGGAGCMLSVGAIKHGEVIEVIAGCEHVLDLDCFQVTQFSQC